MLLPYPLWLHVSCRNRAFALHCRVRSTDLQADEAQSSRLCSFPIVAFMALSMIDKRQEHNSKLRILQFGHLYDRCVRRCPIPPFQRLEHVRQVRAERVVLLRAHVHLSARWAGPGRAFACMRLRLSRGDANLSCRSVRSHRFLVLCPAAENSGGAGEVAVCGDAACMPNDRSRGLICR